MDSKKWYKSKAILAGVVGVLIATYNGVNPELCQHFQVCLPQIPDFVYAVLAGLGIYGRAVANTTVTK